jgi:serine/threonine protein kinase
MVTGRRPFVADSITAIAMQHLHKAPSSLPAESRVLESVCRKLLAKRPEDRSQSAGEVATLLQRMIKPRPAAVAQGG